MQTILNKVVYFKMSIDFQLTPHCNNMEILW